MSESLMPKEVLDFTLRWEGGYANVKDDPGGATNMGITQNTYNTWRKKKELPLQTVKLLTHEEAAEIYAVLYWIPSHADRVPWPMSVAVFDAGVNCGTLTAIKFLQRAAGVSDDGIWGPKTAEAVAALDPKAGALKVCEQRILYYDRIIQRNPKLEKFRKGWLNRVDALKKVIG